MGKPDVGNSNSSGDTTTMGRRQLEAAQKWILTDVLKMYGVKNASCPENRPAPD